MNGQTHCGLEGQNKCHHENRPEYLGFTTGKGGNVGAFSDCISGKDSVRGYILGGDAYDECTPIGKILARLEQLESAYLQYVGAHQSRLEARLDESRSLKQEFISQLSELKQEIYQLATEESSTNGNGYKG
ncbi:hypothetical protein [Nodularia sphaerocarpa]|uniref:hypothetical protein n=1 Tax=Nodularia sphaerocarpa TaxID=137816 RepID=UPI001EFB503A|nr:hypothetical protein [Nodularia sphaerocarpa]MDB9372805.1 hypothetical protein [Nodularia sphaerocarpa CS-585]ULP74150.1 hypothetical protein BDGGKGIB_03813 [Nodularia sphaerocarpa UHCC 0038]